MQSVAVKQLEQVRGEYKEYSEVWQTIDDLRAGASRMVANAHKYVPRRACEDEELYRLRLDKFCYTPILNNRIRELVSKLVTEPMTVDGDTSSVWESFYKDMDGLGTSEAQFMFKLYSYILHYGRLYIGVDRDVGYTPLTLYELEKIAPPRVRLYPPHMVINWADDRSWFITRQMYEETAPFEAPVLKCRWQLWSQITNWTYECPVRLLEGVITEALINGVWMGLEDKRCVLEGIATQHGLPVTPMLCLELSEDEWIGNACYLKQLQHTRLESSWTEAGAVAGTIQRVFTPMPPNPDTDERITFSEPDVNTLKIDNNHVLVGAGFQFVESTGAAIASIQAQLVFIEQQISDLISMSYKSATSNAEGLGVVQQSGVSKQVDMLSLDDTVSSYTLKVAPFYELLLRLVALVMGIPDKPVVNLGNEATDGETQANDLKTRLMDAFQVNELEAQYILTGQEGGNNA